MNATKTNALALAEKPAAMLPINNVNDMQFLGHVLSQCQLFGQRNPAEGLAIVGMCHQQRISWMTFMQNFHMIKGRVSKKADAILADFRRIGGKHSVILRTSEAAEIKLTIGKETQSFRLTWEECMKEPFVYVGNEETVIAQLESGDTSRLVFKAKYRTPRGRMQMLWARVVSDGVRALAPECCQGIYTPEETDDFVDVTPLPAAGTGNPVPVAPSAPASAPAQQIVDGGIEVCPIGPMAGKRWDDETVFSVDVLKQALEGTHQALTPEMKDYIRGLVEKRAPITVNAQVIEPEVAQ